MNVLPQGPGFSDSLCRGHGIEWQHDVTRRGRFARPNVVIAIDICIKVLRRSYLDERIISFFTVGLNQKN
jgi:hypothetical protein